VEVREEMRGQLGEELEIVGGTVENNVAKDWTEGRLEWMIAERVRGWLR
jgi:hypothetical protein